MKKTLVELQKEAKAIELEIAEKLQDEVSSCTYQCAVDEEGNRKDPLIKTSYDYKANSDALAKLRGEQFHVKQLLNKANFSTPVIGYDFTIADGLIKMAQLTASVKRLSQLASKKQESTDVRGYDRHSIIICSYDVETAKADLKLVQKELAKLQIAIDRTNMLTEVDF